jgi:hypothetical protein
MLEEFNASTGIEQRIYVLNSKFLDCKWSDTPLGVKLRLSHSPKYQKWVKNIIFL